MYQAIHNSTPEEIDGKERTNHRPFRHQEYSSIKHNQWSRNQYCHSDAEPGRPDMTGYFGAKDSQRQSGILKRSTQRTGDQSSRKGQSQERSRSPPRLEVGRHSCRSAGRNLLISMVLKPEIPISRIGSQVLVHTTSRLIEPAALPSPKRSRLEDKRQTPNGLMQSLLISHSKSQRLEIN